MDKFSGASVSACRPVLQRYNLYEFVQISECLQSVYNQLPGAVDFLVDFAFSLGGTAARSIEKPLGTTGYDADSGSEIEDAFAAGLATFHKQARFFNISQESGIQSGNHPQGRVSFHQKLDAYTAGNAQHGVRPLDFLFGSIKKLMLTLPFDARAADVY